MRKPEDWLESEVNAFFKRAMRDGVAADELEALRRITAGTHRTVLWRGHRRTSAKGGGAAGRGRLDDPAARWNAHHDPERRRGGIFPQPRAQSPRQAPAPYR